MRNLTHLAEEVLQELREWKFLRHGCEELSDEDSAEFLCDLGRVLASQIEQEQRRFAQTLEECAHALRGNLAQLNELHDQLPPVRQESLRELIDSLQITQAKVDVVLKEFSRASQDISPSPIQLSIDPKAVSRHSSAALGNEPADEDFDSVSEFRDAVCRGELEITSAQHETLERLIHQGFVVEIDQAGRLTFP